MCCTYEYQSGIWNQVSDGCMGSCPLRPQNPPLQAKEGDTLIEPCPVGVGVKPVALQAKVANHWVIIRNSTLLLRKIEKRRRGKKKN